MKNIFGEGRSKNGYKSDSFDLINMRNALYFDPIKKVYSLRKELDTFRFICKMII